MTDTIATTITTAAGSPASGENITVTYHEKPGLGGLSAINWILAILTLGIYRFWGKTNVRKHVWSCVHINGEPLEYTGKGKELFFGALIIFFVILLPFSVITNGLQLAGYVGAAVAFQLIFALVIFGLYGMAIYRARRYRLSRTVWRGVRGGLTGSSFKYSMLYFGTMLLSSITMGWSNPAMNLELQERITREMKFGDTAFGFKGTTNGLYSRYALCWISSFVVFVGLSVLVVLVLAFGQFAEGFSEFWEAFIKEFQKEMNGGSSSISEEVGIVLAVIGIYGAIGILAIIFGVIWSFYTAREMVLFTQYTTFDNARFRLNATGWSLVGLWLGNILLIIFTLGIAAPFTVQRMFRYIVERLEIDGVVDISKIMQSQQEIDARGEGLMDAFDIDGI